MKLLLTSGGITNKSMVAALGELLGKPFGESKVVFIPTAANAERGDKMWLVKDFQRIGDLGWQEFDVVDLPAVQGLDHHGWWSAIKAADVIIVGGGNTFFLSYWFQKSGLMDALPELIKTKVYVGISAGTMVVTDSMRTSSQVVSEFVDPEYDEIGPAGEASQKTAKLVEFVVRPHFNAPYFPKVNADALQKIAAGVSVPMYALDDNSALKVTDGDVQVVSEGEWKLL